MKVLSEEKDCCGEDASTCIQCGVVRNCPDCKWDDECIHYKDEHGFVGTAVMKIYSASIVIVASFVLVMEITLLLFMDWSSL